MEQLTARVVDGTKARVEKLIPFVAEKYRVLLGGKAGQTDVLRLVIERGLTALEQECGPSGEIPPPDGEIPPGHLLNAGTGLLDDMRVVPREPERVILPGPQG